MKIISKIKKNWILIVVLIAALALRLFNLPEYFMYGHDQELAGWIIKDILVNGHLRLIGQETSSQGVFIGPLFYYLQIPFYLITQMDPIGSIGLVTILGMASVFSFYWVFSRVFNRRVGILASAIYGFSYLIVFIDREVAPTMPVMLWTVWYFYALWSILKGRQKAYLFIGFLFGLVWNLNLALLVLAPLTLLAQILSKKKLGLKTLLLGLAIFVITLSPFLVFETRHGFSQTKSIVSSLTTNKDYEGGAAPGLAKLDRVMQAVYLNTTRIFWGYHYSFPLIRVTFFSFIIFFLYLFYKKTLSLELSITMLVWQALYILFFAINSINLSEYYLNGMNIIWIAIAAVSIDYLMKLRGYWKFLSLIFVAFLVSNLLSVFVFYKVSGNNYVEKKELSAFIKKDAAIHGYPCVAISYITSQGYQFGFRYFFWLDGIKTKMPLTGAPVYSIVFPLSLVNGFDERFGNLGLVLPDYRRYTNKSVEKVCQGEDANLTEPMFGYTQ